MKLVRLNARRMPGFPDGGPSLDELSERFNVLVGPNASGKTTWCRALRGALWPASLKKLKPVEIEARFTHAEADWDFAATAKGRDVTRNGVATDTPPLPPDHLAACFTLTVDDFHESGAADNAFVEAVSGAMAGGYNMRAARQQFGASFDRRAPEFRAVDEARKAMAQVLTEQEALRREADRLPEIVGRIEAAREAAREVERFERAAARLKAREAWEDAKAALAEFPPDMGLLGAGDEKDLAALATDLESAAGEFARAEREAREADHARDAAGFADGPPDDAYREALAHQVDAAQKAEARLEALREKEDGAAGRLASAAEALGVADVDRWRATKLEAFGDIDRLLEETQALRAEEAEVRAEIEGAHIPDDAEDADRLSARLADLRMWLGAGGGGVRQGPVWAIRGAAAATAVVAALAAAMFPPFAWVAAALAGGMLALSFFLRAEATGIRREIEARHAEKVEWTSVGVSRAIASLEERVTAARDHQLARRRLQQAQARMSKTAERRSDLERRWTNVAGAAGLGAASPMEIVETARRIEHWRAQDAEHAQASAERAGAEERLAGMLFATGERLRSYGYAPGAGVEEARAGASDLAARCARYAAAVKSAQEARERSESTSLRIDALQKRQGEFFTRRALPAGDVNELRRRLERLAAWKKAEEAERGARREYEKADERTDEADRVKSLAELGAAIEAGRATAQGAEALIEEKARLEERIARAAKQHSVADARAAVEEAVRVARETKLDVERRDAAASLLLADVENAFQTDAKPPMLDEAARLFGLFTRGVCELRFENELKVYDKAAKEHRLLPQLSTGTRMQLLLAVRVAFAQSAEIDAKLPLVLDEVLSATDPERFAAVADAVLELVKDGRQVFYLTCQPPDAAIWRERAKAAGVEMREYRFGATM